MDITLPTPPHPLRVDRLADPAVAGETALVLLESMSDGVYVVDSQWRIIFVNAAFVDHMQVPGEDLVGSILWDVIHQVNRPRLESAFRRILASGKPEIFVQESVMFAGRTMDVRVYPVQAGLAVIFRDITRRVHAERALATSEEHLRRALDGASMGDWAWNAETDLMTLSDRAKALYGLDKDSAPVTRAALRLFLVHADDIPVITAAAARAHAEQDQYEVTYRVRRPEGWRWMRVMGGPHLVDGRVIGMHGLVQDIHEMKLANERLQAEVQERERGQQRQLLLIHELNHRVKNILAMVQAMAMQTLSTARSPEAARVALEDRLLALAGAHDVITRESWDGAELSDIVAGAVAPHESRPGRRFHLQGPRVRLEPKAAVSLALALHELATNATKYGALSVEGGWVDVDWSAHLAEEGQQLVLTWTEHGGPPVHPPTRTGFGTRLISRSMAAEQGKAELDYRPQGLFCRLCIKLSPGPPEIQPI